MTADVIPSEAEGPGRAGHGERASRPASPGSSTHARNDTAWLVLFILALIWVAALLHRAQPLGWDEVEFHRATRWTGEGRVPFRDFWEHHTPLQWILFAPVARLIANGPGADAIVAMRWAQVVLWVAILMLVMRLSRDRELSRDTAASTVNRQPSTSWWAAGYLLVSPLFVRSAIEYRVDVPGNLAYLAAIVLALKQRWIAFGAVMSLAVLANMRLAPLVVVTALILLFRNPDGERWKLNVRALAMIGGVAAVAVPFVGWLVAAGAWQPFLDGIVDYNARSAKLVEDLDTRLQFIAPLLQYDLAAIVLWCAAVASTVRVLRDIRRPGVLQIVALLFIASVVTLTMMEVQYEYHFQLTYLLMVPLAADAFARAARWQWLALTVAAIALVLAVLPYVFAPFGEAMRYQDFVMREVDRRTGPDERVFDGNGYALRREPAYRYWFLATGVRFLAAHGAIAPFDIAAKPPAAVIYNLRMQRWFEIFPATAAYAVRHYVPLTRDLWVPGMTATLQPQRAATWVAPAAGRYTLWPSETLLRHPWLTKPLEYASLQGERATRYAIPLPRLPLAQRVEWSVDGFPVTGRSVELKKGSRVTLLSHEPRAIGVLLVPSDIATLAVAPAEEFQF